MSVAVHEQDFCCSNVSTTSVVYHPMNEHLSVACNSKNNKSLTTLGTTTWHCPWICSMDRKEQLEALFFWDYVGQFVL